MHARKHVSSHASTQAHTQAARTQARKHATTQAQGLKQEAGQTCTCREELFVLGTQSELRTALPLPDELARLALPCACNVRVCAHVCPPLSLSLVLSLKGLLSFFFLSSLFLVSPFLLFSFSPFFLSSSLSPCLLASTLLLSFSPSLLLRRVWRRYPHSHSASALHRTPNRTHARTYTHRAQHCATRTMAGASVGGRRAARLPQGAQHGARGALAGAELGGEVRSASSRSRPACRCRQPT